MSNQRPRYGLVRCRSGQGSLHALYDIVDHGDGTCADQPVANGVRYEPACIVVDALNERVARGMSLPVVTDYPDPE